MSLKIIGCWRKGKPSESWKKRPLFTAFSSMSKDSQGNVFSSKASFIIRKSTTHTQSTLSVIERLLYYLWKINRPFRLKNRSLIKIDKNRKKRYWLGIAEVQFRKLNLCHTLGFLRTFLSPAFGFQGFFGPQLLQEHWYTYDSENVTWHGTLRLLIANRKKKEVVIVKHNETLPQLPTRWAPFCLENNF